MTEPTPTQIEEAYGAAGRAAAEAVLKHGLDGAQRRPANDAFLISRVARACVDAAFAARSERIAELEDACRRAHSHLSHIHALRAAVNTLADALDPRADPETAKWCSTCGSDDPGFDRHAPDGLHPMESCPDPFHFDTTQPGNPDD